MKDHAIRMLNEARKRQDDADILSQSGASFSDSSAILRILALEILLKCAIHLCGQNPKFHHDYSKHWKALPGYAQKEILKKSKSRMSGHTDFSSIDKILKWYQIIFEKGRYFYEFYEGYTLSEQTELGSYWAELGSPLNEADLQYFPLELACLNEALEAFIESRL